MRRVREPVKHEHQRSGALLEIGESHAVRVDEMNRITHGLRTLRQAPSPMPRCHDKYPTLTVGGGPYFVGATEDGGVPGPCRRAPGGRSSLERRADRLPNHARVTSAKMP